MRADRAQQRSEIHPRMLRVGRPRPAGHGTMSAMPPPAHPVVPPILDWYAGHARDLPWRRPTAGPWGVLVSEFMLQQTPVARVLPVYEAWLARWPNAGALAAEPSGEAVRAWGRLGYPRRALRLHQAATAIRAEHGGVVPDTLEDLLALPGVGAYTARAVAAFAFGQAHAVLDSNVRRVLGRLLNGAAEPGPAVTTAEMRQAQELLPTPDGVAARWSVAVMELGALVCTARSPRCADCPVAEQCTWLLAGRPPAAEGRRRVQTYAGTDRQVRGRLLAVLRDADGPVPASVLDAVWDDAEQRARALDGLVADGLAVAVDAGYALPA